MEMIIDFPGGARVDAHFGPYTVHTDQPPQGGGEGSAPTPFAVFLSSIGTCAGIYALGFCRQRGLNTDGLRIIQRIRSNPMTGMVQKVDLEIELPADFPEKYRAAIINAVELCAVKKHMEQPPQFDVTTKQAQPA
ncbi:MAG: OsmC family protein [Chloroflexi bacterium]|nr:OsmC family protein [Chloroflexota bacterium]